MCVEFALKRGGIPLIRNFLHASEGVKYGLPLQAQQRMNIEYTFKSFKNGKVQTQTTVNTVAAAFPCKGDQK